MRLFLSCLLSLLPSLGVAVQLIALKASPGPVHSHFEFILAAPTPGRMAILNNPHRVVVELKEAESQFDLEDLPLKAANVTSIESETLPHQHLRFIFFTRGRVQAKATFTAMNRRLLIDIQSLSIESKRERVQPRTLALRTAKRQVTIVIDAGHGGSDPGARGPHAYAEKNIVLSIARQLAKSFDRSSNVRIVMTRTQDHFVPLRERLTLARKSKAQLFIAIHADGYFTSQAEGASVYALSKRGASSEAARWLAQRENYSELGGIELNALKDKSPILRKVLIDLAQTSTINASVRLGDRVLRELSKVTRLHHPRVEQAPFLVLKSPDIPSVLIETGFISNPKEERQLANPRYQAKLVDAIHRGIMGYLAHAAQAS